MKNCYKKHALSEENAPEHSNVWQKTLKIFTIIVRSRGRLLPGGRLKMKIFLIFCYHILLGLGQGFETVEHAKYCVSDSPLDTPYFVPFYKTVRPALGCARAPEDHEKTEVHVVRLNQPEDDVFLYVTGTVIIRFFNFY